MNEDRKSWVAFCSVCGKWYGAAVDDPAFSAENSKRVARWMKDGARVEKLAIQAFRDQAGDMCECRRKNKAVSKQAALDGLA